MLVRTLLFAMAMNTGVGLTAGLAAQQKDQDAIETCEVPYGKVFINEPEARAVRALSGYNLGSPAALLRIMVQESNCFQVVERGSGLDQMRKERSLANSGELQQGSNVGGGQMAAADFVLTPGVTFSDMNAGGVGGVVGGATRRLLGVGGAALKFKEAETSLLISNVRTGVQVAAASGKARKTDVGWGALARLGIGAGAGGYASTDEGKIIAASFRDNFNNLVRSFRANPGAGSASPKAGAVFAEGDVLRAKIAGVRVMRGPKDGSAVVATLTAGDTVVYLGEETSGYLKVLSSAGEGWVRKLAVAK